MRDKRGGRRDSLRLLVGGLIILALAGCAPHQTDKVELQNLIRGDYQDSSRPATTVWLKNLTGERICDLSLNVKLAEISDHYTSEMNIGKEEQEIWSIKTGDSLVLETLTVHFENGAQSEFSLDHHCLPDDKVLLILDIAGRMIVKAKE